MKIKKFLSMFSRDPIIKYESRHDAISSIATRMGHRVYNRNLIWHTDKEYIDTSKSFASAPSIHERKFTLYNIAKSLRDISGDIVECGVFKAHSSFLMLAASEGTAKNFYGFDSFEGLSEPNEDDQILNSHSFKWKKNDLSVQEQFATQTLQKFDGKFTLYKGWIPTRFQEISDKKISLLHIDVDLHEPTLASLEYFYPRMVKGGAIVCDDYGFETCPGAKKAMDEFFEKHGLTVIHLTTGQGVVFTR